MSGGRQRMGTPVLGWKMIQRATAGAGSKESGSANELWRRWKEQWSKGREGWGKKHWDSHLAGGGTSSAGLVPLRCCSTLALSHHLALSFSLFFCLAPSLLRLSPGLESVNPSNTLHGHIWSDKDGRGGGSPCFVMQGKREKKKTRKVGCPLLFGNNSSKLRDS